MSELSIKDLKNAAERSKMVDVLLDPKQYAEKVLKGGKVVNVITREIYEADIAINGEYILMVGDCSFLIGEGTKVFDMAGKYLTPGFIDSHMHFESSMLNITEFSRLSLPSGTTCLIADHHEIGNVLGPAGIRAMCDEAALMPHHICSRVPALCPDSPGLETSGANICSKDIPEMLNYPTVTGIGETQGITSVEGVYKNNPEIFRDTIASTIYARALGKTVDGNATELFGKQLAAHIIAGGTDVSCHETCSKEETIEKLRNGMYVLVREGSTGKNMSECIRAFTENNLDFRRAILATDDMLAEDIARAGHMNDVIRRTIKAGMDPVTAVQMATINAATWQNLKDIGVLAPGKLADIAVIEGMLEDMNVSQVFLKGQLVAENRELLINLPRYTYPDFVKHSVKLKPIKPENLYVPNSKKGTVKVRCVGLIENQADHTLAVEAETYSQDGFVRPSVENDILPIAVVGRHGQSDIGTSFVRGFAMKRGAFAETVAHDAHNIIVMGTNYEDMAAAVNRLIELQGGLVLVKDGKVIGELPLRVAGLITDELSGNELSEQMNKLTKLAETELECKVHAPFMHLGFLSLSTGPRWRITDKGLLDVINCRIIPTVIE